MSIDEPDEYVEDLPEDKKTYYYKIMKGIANA